MKRPKVVIGIFVGLILIVLVIVLFACAVFVIRHVEVELEVSSHLLNEESILQSSGLSVGSSIITIDKEEIKERIEKENPYVEVTKISREYPNKVIIRVTVRTGILLVRSEGEGNSAAIIDAKMQVLDVIPYTESMKAEVTPIEGLRFKLPEEGPLAAIGVAAAFDNPLYGEVLAQITAAAEAQSISGKSFIAFIESISFTTEDSVCKVYVKTKKGVTLVLNTAMESAMKDQLGNCIYCMYEEKMTVDVTKGYIFWDSTHGLHWAESLD